MPALTLPLATVGLAPPAARHSGVEFLAPLFLSLQVTEGQTLAVELSPPGCVPGG